MSRTSANLTWDPPQFTGPGVDGYEISVTPAVAGYPQTVSGTSHTIVGLNPNRRYTVSVRALGGGVLGEATQLRLDLINSCFNDHLRDNPLWICPWRPPKPNPYN